MILFGHHIGIDLFGKEIAPETPLEHVCFLAVTIVFLGLAAYGAYAGWRDFQRWRKGA